MRHGSGFYDRDPDERPETPIRGEAALAGAVIRQALADITSRGRWLPPGTRADARRFLLDADGALSFWLQVLDVDERRVRALIARVLLERERQQAQRRTDASVI